MNKKFGFSIASGVLLAVLLGVALWQALPEKSPSKAQAKSAAQAESALQTKSVAKTKAKRQHGLGDLEPYDLTYGIYLNGQKTGWMQTTLQIEGSKVETTQYLEATILGMGQRSTLKVDEKRIYNAKTHLLESLRFKQSAATGAVEVKAERIDPTTLNIEVTTAGTTSELKAKSKDSLAQFINLQRFVENPKVGQTLQVHRFDASMQKEMEANYQIEKVSNRVFGGVETPTVKVKTTYPAMGIVETAWVDGRDGKLLESKIGGFFVARLEPPSVAKQLDYQQDLLVSAIVKPPAPISNQEELQLLKLELVGMGSISIPQSQRQKVQKKDDTVLLELRRDPAIPARLKLHQAIQNGPKKYLKATPFIQSEDPQLVERANAVVRGANNAREVVQKLSEFVFSHVQDEYVPAYSNAKEALLSGRGDCTEHSVLFVALARALNIPARVAVGIAYWPPGDGFGWHAWGEVWLDGKWYAVDPTWNQSVADATHIKLASGGPAEQAKIVMLLGQLKIQKMQLK